MLESSLRISSNRRIKREYTKKSTHHDSNVVQIATLRDLVIRGETEEEFENFIHQERENGLLEHDGKIRGEFGIVIIDKWTKLNSIPYHQTSEFIQNTHKIGTYDFPNFHILLLQPNLVLNPYLATSITYK